VVAERTPPATAKNARDALAIVLDTHGEVRLPEVARLLGTDEKHARQALGTLVFDDHDGSGRLIPRAEYLSGNVRQKLEDAEKAAEDDPKLTVNAEALRAVLPADKTPGEINARLGAAWIDEKHVQDFARELMNDHNATVEHPGGSVWGVKSGYAGNKHIRATSEWGTERRNFYDLLESILTGKQIEVRDTYENPDGSKYTVKNPVATLAAQEKAEAIKERFADWVWENPEPPRSWPRVQPSGSGRSSPAPTTTPTGRPCPACRPRTGRCGPHQHAAIARIVVRAVRAARPRGRRRQDPRDGRRRHGAPPPRPRAQARDRRPEPHARAVLQRVP
jgi:N12 class adenine-specific DNA methylase